MALTNLQYFSSFAAYNRKVVALRNSKEAARPSLSDSTQIPIRCVKNAKGKDVPSLVLYWFVWKGINPGSDLFRPHPSQKLPH